MAARYPGTRQQHAAVFDRGICVGNNVWYFSGTGAPVDGTSGTGAGWAGPGSEYTRTVSTIKKYINGGTTASPVWKLVTSAA